MARCPFARWRPLPENAYAPRIVPTQHVLHTAVDAPGPTDLHRFFARADVTVESHFWVRLDGTLEQFMDTERRADANRNANRTAVSTETEDDGNPAQRAWTPQQVETLIRLQQWLHATHGIPNRRCSSPTGAGVGFHSQWGSPSPWTTASGKTCPGAARIPQVAAVIAGAAGERVPDLPHVPRVLLIDRPLMRGEDVRAAQVALNAAGFPCGTDGVYGQETANAVHAFQAAHPPLGVDGVLGPATRRVLMEDPEQWPVGAIRDKWLALGGTGGLLGKPLTHELGCPDGVGRYTHFVNGSIYWTPDLGAHEVHGMIRATWERLGWERNPLLGYPTSDEHVRDGDPVSTFQRGEIRWSAADSVAHVTGRLGL